MDYILDKKSKKNQQPPFIWDVFIVQRRDGKYQKQ